MPTFEYTARDIDGRERNGVMQAESQAAVVRTLNERAMFPVQIASRDEQAGAAGRGRPVKLSQLSVAYGQLSDLLAAGVPMLRSLEILARTTVNPRLGRVIAEVREEVSSGETLADAMAKHPGVFVTLHVAMVRAGEHAGFLEDVLANLAGFMERQDELRSKVRGAMIYPVVLATVGVLVVTGILVLLVPQFREFLADSQKALPWPSQLLFAISEALLSHGWTVLMASALVVVLVRAYLRSQMGQKHWSQWQLKIPVAGRAIRMVAVTRFCRVLGTMLHNGVPIIQALEISKDAAGNEMLANAIADAGENVRAGEPLADPLARSRLFDTEIVEMIAVGEESNQLEKVLVHVADTVERRTNRQVDAAVRLIEPLMLMFMAAMIGFIAVGLLYPIFTMARNMR